MAWRSPLSTPEQKANAVNTLILPGTKVDEVVRLLGNDGVFCHYGGGVTIGGENVESGRDLWQLEYRMAAGTVALCFKAGANWNKADYSFIRAVVQRNIDTVR